MPSVIPAATDFLHASIVLAGEIAKLNMLLHLFKDNEEEVKSISTEIHRLQLVFRYCSDYYYEFKENNKEKQQRKTVNQVINDLLTAIENNRFKFKFGEDRGVLVFEEFENGGLKLFKDTIRNPYVFFMNEYIWFNNESESEIRNISERTKAIFSKATEVLQQEALKKIDYILNPQF